MEHRRHIRWLGCVKVQADKAIDAVYRYFGDKQEASRLLGVAFLTRETRQKYLMYIAEQWKGDDGRIERVFDRVMIGRGMRVNFWRYMMLILAIMFAVGHYNPLHPFALIAYGVSFYVFTHLAFIYGLEAGNKKLAREIYEMVGRKKKIRDAQKPVSICVDKETFQFSLQDILTIEYFLWKGKEKTELINFSYPVNSKIIEEKIFRKWKIKKPATFAKLIASPVKPRFAFLSYKLKKENRKVNAVNTKIETILNYLAVNNYFAAKQMLEDFFELYK